MPFSAAVAGVVPPTAIDWNDPATIEIEKRITFTYGRKFKDRGPPPPAEGGPEQWRHQKWRESGGRWGNRGGKNKLFWNAVFGGKAKGGKGDGKKGSGKKGDDKGDGDQGDGKKGGDGGDVSGDGAPDAST